MRRFLAIPLVLLAIAGCATQTDPMTVSDWEICEYTMQSGNNGVVADAEARRRGLDCRPYYPAILAKRQQQGQALRDAASYFNRPAPAIAPPQSVHCTSYRAGNTVQTNCN